MVSAVKKNKMGLSSYIVLKSKLSSARIMEEGFFECTLFYCCYEKTAYVTETAKSHLADFTSEPIGEPKRKSAH